MKTLRLLFLCPTWLEIGFSTKAKALAVGAIASRFIFANIDRLAINRTAGAFTQPRTYS
jgi:hypothetical protein